MAEDREDFYNEVVYGLGVLYEAVRMSQIQNALGVQLALEYVRAMREAER